MKTIKPKQSEQDTDADDAELKWSRTKRWRWKAQQSKGRIKWRQDERKCGNRNSKKSIRSLKGFERTIMPLRKDVLKIRTFWKLGPETLIADTICNCGRRLAGRRRHSGHRLCYVFPRLQTIDNIDGEINLLFLLSLT
jgi:hypothetical protein